MFVMAIWDPTAKFNSRQYFRLYGISYFAAQRLSDWLLEQAKYIKTCPVMDNTFIMR